jgi:hypothetical protein
MNVKKNCSSSRKTVISKMHFAYFRKPKRGEHYELTQQEILEEIKANESYMKRKAERMAAAAGYDRNYNSRYPEPDLRFGCSTSYDDRRDRDRGGYDRRDTRDYRGGDRRGDPRDRRDYGRR